VFQEWRWRLKVPVPQGDGEASCRTGCYKWSAKKTSSVCHGVQALSIGAARRRWTTRRVSAGGAAEFVQWPSVMVTKASCEPSILDITEQRKRAINQRLLSVKTFSIELRKGRRWKTRRVSAGGAAEFVDWPSVMVRKASCEPPILDITEQRKRAINQRLLSVKTFSTEP
jgi:hypothetical protein